MSVPKEKIDYKLHVAIVQIKTEDKEYQYIICPYQFMGTPSSECDRHSESL